MKFIVLLVLFVSLIAAQPKPKNYFGASTSVRGQQQEMNGFAVWNFTSQDWIPVIPPNFGGTAKGFVAVGSGVLAYGTITSVNGNPAAGLAYYDGSKWCVPEGVGLYSYTPNILTTQFNNSASISASSAFAAYVENNDVYLLGTFNQVGLVQGGVAGFAKLTWSAGGVFTLGNIGAQNYNQQLDNTIPCNLCPRKTQPTEGDKNELKSYTNGTTKYFVYQDSRYGNLYQWAVDSPNWIQITNSNNARNISGHVVDFDIDSNTNTIYVVGQFNNLNDPTAANRYLHIAQSQNNGGNWVAVGNNILDPKNWGDLGLEIYNGIWISPVLVGRGLTAISVTDANNIYIAGFYRVTQRNISDSILAGEEQVRVARINTGANSVTLLGTRFNNNVTFLATVNTQLYAFGIFTAYNQINTADKIRFVRRYDSVLKGAARYVSGGDTWVQAMGGWLTTTYSGDTSPDPNTLLAAAGTDSFNNILFYVGGAFKSSYRSLSGGLFGYGGDPDKNQTDRWNPLLDNNRFVRAGDTSGAGFEGQIRALHILNGGSKLIVGGRFDFVGGVRIGSVGAYDPVTNSIAQVGGGVYNYNNNGPLHADSEYNNRVGGIVNDIEQWNDRLYVAGTFNRNGSGTCVGNIAECKYQVTGQGWEPVDWGCDNTINDMIVSGSTLYVTGSFQFCGSNSINYDGGLGPKGRIPSSAISRIDLSDSKRQWRPLGLGLLNSGGTPIGVALAWRRGSLYVSGTFTSAGGRIETNGLARWNGEHWYDVVAVCRGNCDRPVEVFPYIGNSTVPYPDQRRPKTCNALREISGTLWCIDSNGVLAYYSGSTWRSSGQSANTGIQNSVIVRNATESDYIVVSGTSAAGSNNANYMTFDKDELDWHPSYAGFSVAPAALAPATTFTIPTLFISFIVLIIAIIF